MTDRYPQIRLLDANCVPYGIVNDYEYFRWEHSWYEIDTFTLRINRYRPYIGDVTAHLLADNGVGFIAYEDPDVSGNWNVGIIQGIVKPLESDGKASEQWEITGVGIEGIFAFRRCREKWFDSTYDGYDLIRSQSFETAMRYIVDTECIDPSDNYRVLLPNLTLAATDQGRPVSDNKLILDFADALTIDASQYDHTVQNPTAYVEYHDDVVKFYRSAKFTGGYLLCPSDADFNIGTNDFSISFWIAFTVLPSAGQYQTIWTDNVDASNRINFSLYNDGGALKWRWGVTVAGTPTAVAVGAPAAGVNAGVWYYISAGRTGTTWTIHQDGVQAATGTSASTISGSGAIIIGIHYDLSSNVTYAYLEDLVTSIGSKADATVVPVKKFVDPLVAQKRVRMEYVSQILQDFRYASGVSCGLTWTDATSGSLTDRTTFTFDVWEGSDVSGNVRLSVNWSDFLSYRYLWDITNVRNLLYCGGKGDGESRILAEAYDGDTPPSGLERREDFFDTSQSQSIVVAAAAGAEHLKTLGDTNTVDFVFDWRNSTYTLGVSFSLGDIVTLYIADAVEIASRIVKVVETYDEFGRTLRLSLGTDPKNDVKMIRNMNKNILASGAH